MGSGDFASSTTALANVRLTVTYCSQSDVRKMGRDRKSTRLNSSHSQISYAVFCLKKKKKHSDEVVVTVRFASPLVLACRDDGVEQLRDQAHDHLATRATRHRRTRQLPTRSAGHHS